MNRRRAACGALWIALICACAAGLAARAEQSAVSYFYQKICASCDPRAEFAYEFRQLTGESPDLFSYETYDVDLEPGMRALERALAPFGVRAADAKLPVLIYADRLYMGQDQIRAELPAYVVQRGAETESFLYYLAAKGCRSCANVEALLGALPDELRVARGDYTFASKLRIERIDIAESPTLALALFDAFGVPGESRAAPLILAGDAHYQGEQAVERFLKYSLPAGRAIGTPRIQMNDAAPARGPLLWGALALAALAALIWLLRSRIRK